MIEHECCPSRERVKEALAFLAEGCPDGEHHVLWVIDQTVRILAGEGYEEWVDTFCAGEEGPQTYEWDEGVAP